MLSSLQLMLLSCGSLSCFTNLLFSAASATKHTRSITYSFAFYTKWVSFVSEQRYSLFPVSSFSYTCTILRHPIVSYSLCHCYFMVDYCIRMRCCYLSLENYIATSERWLAVTLHGAESIFLLL